MHAKLVFFEDILLRDSQWQLYIAAAAVFVYFAMSHISAFPL